MTFFRRPLLYSAPLDVLAMPKEEKKWEKLYAWMSDLVNSCLPLFFQCFLYTYVSIPVILLETKILNPMLNYDLSSNITSEENLLYPPVLSFPMEYLMFSYSDFYPLI